MKSTSTLLQMYLHQIEAYYFNYYLINITFSLLDLDTNLLNVNLSIKNTKTKLGYGV